MLCFIPLIIVGYIVYSFTTGLIGTGILLLGMFIVFVLYFELIAIKNNTIKVIRIFKKKAFPFEEFKNCVILEKAFYSVKGLNYWAYKPHISNKLDLVFILLILQKTRLFFLVFRSTVKQGGLSCKT